MKKIFGIAAIFAVVLAGCSAGSSGSNSTPVLPAINTATQAPGPAPAQTPYQRLVIPKPCNAGGVCDLVH